MQRDGWEYGRQRWRCSVRNNTRMAEWYDGLSNTAYLHRQLRHRRNLALARMKRREELS